jgi:hypothetical protein
MRSTIGVLIDTKWMTIDPGRAARQGTEVTHCAWSDIDGVPEFPVWAAPRTIMLGQANPMAGCDIVGRARAREQCRSLVERPCQDPKPSLT